MVYGDYIVYEGNKYYPAKDGVWGNPIDQAEKVSVRLYKNDGRRIGILQRFYAYKVAYNEEGIFLNFDSMLFTSDLKLADEEWLP